MLSPLCLGSVAAPNPSPGVERQRLRATGRIHKEIASVYVYVQEMYENEHMVLHMYCA